MASLSIATAVLLFTVSLTAHNTNSCLPADIKPSDVVATRLAKPGIGGKDITVTVAQKLKELRARCRGHKLVDGGGREIRFYKLIGCWGNPPDDYQEQLQRQTKELASLRKRYRVIEMTCNPSGQQISILPEVNVRRAGACPATKNVK